MPQPDSAVMQSPSTSSTHTLPFVVILTGGIGCGKSTVAALFGQHHIPLIDTDLIAHQLARPPSPILPLIASQFGPEALTGDGALNRPHMRQLIFNDPGAKQRFEAIIHPAIQAQVRLELQTVTAPYVLVAVPLYFETGSYRDIAKRVLVVDCLTEQQITRTMERSGLSRTEVEAIMRHQVSRQERLNGADDVIDNSRDTVQLATQVDALHTLYTKLAQNIKKNS